MQVPLSPEEFDEWFQEHKNTKQCQINYEGSSGSMERAAILILFKRSIKKLKLRYTSLLGDEDTKSIEEINLNQPLWPSGYRNKGGMCGHVAKRPCNRQKYLCQKGVIDEHGKIPHSIVLVYIYF